MVDYLAIEAANARADARATGPRAIAARYVRGRRQLAIKVASGALLAIPVRLVQQLDSALPEDLAIIEITPSGLGLHFPRLDADVYVPALVEGATGTRKWMAARGGAARTEKKIAAARKNGKRGGRPRKRDRR